MWTAAYQRYPGSNSHHFRLFLQNFPKMFVPRLLPYLLDGLDSVKAGTDHSAATYLILSTLMRALRLTPTLVSSLVEALFRSPHEALFGQAVMLLSGIVTTTATAQYLQAMPKKALGALVNRAPVRRRGRLVEK